VISAEDFTRVRGALGGVAEADISWAEGCQPPTSAVEFAYEAIFVICNSGMKNTVARGIYDRVVPALQAGRPVLEVFRHPGKAAAIEQIWRKKTQLLAAYLLADDKLANLEALPWIGGITKYHLAKNFGLPYAKPDVHLQRLADREGCTPQALCERISREVGLGVNAVDTVLWRACANGVINSNTGEIRT
jgi:hypothetical protein